MNTNRLEQAIKAAKEDKKNARIAKAHVEAWSNSLDTQLWHVYKSHSIYKEQAFEYCKQLMYDLKGYGLRILSANTTAFTVGFMFFDPETGDEMFAYITKDYDRFCYA